MFLYNVIRGRTIIYCQIILYFISFQVIDALKAGAQVFKTLSQESGLTIDNVEKIMGDVEDVRLYH